jgi:hypothetical protein
MKLSAALVLNLVSLAGLALLAPLGLGAQQARPGEAVVGLGPGPADLPLLDRLYAYSTEYSAALPSLSCDESIVSQEVKNGKVKWEVRIESTLRELRKGTPAADDHFPDDPFNEQHDFHSVDGKPPKPKFRIPYFVQGGFANGVGFSYPEHQACFDYTITVGELPGTVRVERTGRVNSGNPACAKVFPGYHAVTIAEEATGRVLHAERTISEEEARSGKQAYFAAIDYAPRQFGDRTFLLPVKFVSHDAKDEGRMEATYSNCHRYAGEMKIMRDGGPVKGQTDAPGAH